MLTIILTTILPIFLVAGLGAVLDKTKLLDTRTISRIAIYLTTPALGFYGMANASIKGNELTGLVLVAFLSFVAITLLAWLVAILFKMDRLTASAFVLSVALANIANFGLPLNEFTFGQPGLERAIIYTVVGSIYTNTVGIFLASWGRASIWQAVKNVAKVPTPYFVALGLLVNTGYVTVPDFVMSVAGILRGAAVPLMLLMLGIQVARVSLNGQRWGVVLGASGMRLVVAPLVSWLITLAVGVEGVTQNVAIVEAAMPAAVLAVVLATEFDSDAKLAGSIVLVSTLLSILSLSILLLLL